MKKLASVVLLSVAALGAHAGPLSGLLDGMMINVTAAGSIDSQLRGGLTGPSAYIRTPIRAITPISIDPPRFSAGCGGIDAFFGGFSFISADKMTQFIRQIAQNAAPLAFKMAIDSAFPQLGGLLDKFQQMAQQMNDLTRNSCEMARGVIDAAKNPAGAMTDLQQSLSKGYDAAKGAIGDLAEGFSKVMEKPSESVKGANAAQNADGSKAVNELGNIVWNAMKIRERSGYIFGITDNPDQAKELIMSLVGTTIRKEGDTDGNVPISKQMRPILTLNELLRPSADTNGSFSVKKYKCNDYSTCQSVTQEDFQTGGIKGYVQKMMFGQENSYTPIAGSIVYNIENCNDKSCGLTASQKNFLTVMNKAPVIGLLRRSQRSNELLENVAKNTLDILVDEVSVFYGRYIISTLREAYNGSAVPEPDYFDATIKQIQSDLAIVESRSIDHVAKLNQIVAYIDIANRSHPAVLAYKPQ